MATICRGQLFLNLKGVASQKLPLSSDLVSVRFQLPERNENRASRLVLTGGFSGGSVARASPANSNITSVGDDEGVSLGTMKLPMNTDIDRFETLLFQFVSRCPTATSYASKGGQNPRRGKAWVHYNW